MSIAKEFADALAYDNELRFVHCLPPGIEAIMAHPKFIPVHQYAANERRGLSILVGEFGRVGNTVYTK